MYELSTILEQKLNEATTMDAVAFIPGQLGVVQALHNLSKEKPDWDIQVLESDEESTVTFGDRLKISVPKKHWGAFSTLFREGMDAKTRRVNLVYTDESIVSEFGYGDAEKQKGDRAKGAKFFHPDPAKVQGKSKISPKDENRTQDIQTIISAFEQAPVGLDSRSPEPHLFSEMLAVWGRPGSLKTIEKDGIYTEDTGDVVSWETIAEELENFDQETIDELLALALQITESCAMPVFGTLLRKATRFHPVLSNMRLFERTVKSWIRAFPNSKFVTESNSSVPSICWKGRTSVLAQFMVKAKKECRDRGSREILLQALSEKSSLDSTLFFRKHNVIVGSRISSVYEGVTLVFEATVAFDGKCSYTLVVADREVCDVIEEAVRGPIRIGNVFTLHCNPLSQIQAIKNAVDESIDIEEAAKAEALKEEVLKAEAVKLALKEKKTKKESQKNDPPKSNRS